MAEPGQGLRNRQLSYSSSSAVSSRKSSNDPTTNIIAHLAETSNLTSTPTPSEVIPICDEFHDDGDDGAAVAAATINRTRKLSVVSFTSAEYNKNDDQWEEEAANSHANTNANTNNHYGGIKQGITEEEYDDTSDGLSSGYTSSSSSSSSSLNSSSSVPGCCIDSAGVHRHGRARTRLRRRVNTTSAITNASTSTGPRPRPIASGSTSWNLNANLNANLNSNATANANANANVADRERLRQRRARDRKLLRDQTTRRRFGLAQQPRRPIPAILHASVDDDGMLLSGPTVVSSCYGGRGVGPVAAIVPSQNLGFPRQHGHTHCPSSSAPTPASRSPPSLFRASTPVHIPHAKPPTTKTITANSGIHARLLSPSLLNPNRDADNASPNGFHRHSLSNSSSTSTPSSSHHHSNSCNNIHDYNNNNNINNNSQSHSHSYDRGNHHHHDHHDHHLHKRRRRLDYDLPEIHFLAPPSPVPNPPSPATHKGHSHSHSHSHSLSATSAAELLSSASLHTPDHSPNLSQRSLVRPAALKGRSYSTPAGGADEFYSPLQSISASPVRPTFFTDALREQWEKQSLNNCQVYDMVLAPSVQTFSIPIKSRSPLNVVPPTAAPPAEVSPQLLKSLAVPIRNSPPTNLRSVQLLEVISNDPRPTFLLGTASTTTAKESQLSSTTIHELKLEVVYHNDAFSSILPDAAFSTTSVESGYHSTTFNITDPRYHRWISSSFSNTSTKNGKCRPYVCPDGILWTQNAFTCSDGSRMVLICGVPLPSTTTDRVHISKGEICPPHIWEKSAEVAKITESLRDEDDATTLVSDAQPFVTDPGTPSIGVMGQLKDTCSTPGCISIGRASDGDAERVPRSSYFEAIPVPNYYTQVAKDMDSDMVISPSSTPAPESPQAKEFLVHEDEEASKSPTEEMDVSDDIVQTNHNPEVSTVYSPHLPSDYGFFDWSRLPPEVVSDPHLELVRAVDWTSTGFGPIEDWPQSLRTMINLVLSSPHPAAMYWGSEFSIVYNEAYIPLIGAKHPSLLGRKYKDGWSEIWEAIEPFFMEAVRTGKPTNKEDDRLFILRNGFREETYFSWSICPIIGEDGTTIGLHNPAFEKTRRVIAERRMLTLREVGERCGSARDVKSFWGHVLEALETNPWDAPFAMLYSCKKTDATDSEVSSSYASSLSNTRVYSLEGTIGVPEGHPAAPAILDLKSNAEGFSIAFREALQIEGNIFLNVESGTLPADLMEGLDIQGFSEDMCTSTVVCPINPSSETPLGFLVLGINPRRPFDEDYRLFIQLLTRQLTTSIASVVLYEEEIRRAQRAVRLAALDRVELSHQLAIKSKEAEHSELKFTRLAEFAPVGVFIADFQGKISYYNDMFSEVSCHPRNLDVSRWLESVHPADAARTEANWNEVIRGKKRKTWEFRWKTPWMLPNHLGEQVDRWTLFSASPELDSDGMLLGVFGSITNISETKFAEDLQKRRVEEVVELKRQQDNFVDMASHEMRNPLSAILQGADAVLGSLERYREIASSQDLLEDIESSIDVAQTISLCALHQKRVVDDILTMSKLDSALLTVTPVDVQPIAVVERAFKMFEQEAISSETKMTFKIDDSYRNLNIDWVKLDPARLLQVLINLLTNALKFLRTEPSKSIIVTMGGSVKRPSSKDRRNSLVYFPSTRKAADLTTGPEWGDGESVFLTFSVFDTGKGLTEAEKKNLFQKFSQATAKTEVSYGGSGLGLFICKELVHLQSGEIGVQSEAGKGCCFSFYVKSRRSSRPEIEIPQAPVLRSTGTSKRKESSQSSPAVSSPINDQDFNAARPQLHKPSQSSDGKSSLDYKVLIVEDNLVNQKLLRKALENSGCTTYVANHGVEALEMIKESVYWKGAREDALELSLILMDVEMPVMDGLTCSKQIRELQAEGSILGHIPIVAVTANARQAQIDRMFAAGMDDVVSKPYRIKELIPKLHSVVSKYKDRDTIGVDED
ncbi:hypothetical protein AOL_s00004g600 [Orbilia oligospora ATCC 24927]|uniref:Uncharacterized protein n=2 Tax=Orbilia oligospora TaxID=2813651 RepID=G1WZ89_ARTOA|nr:hypothetical protein AOL_s00004g600 [Orbilia oligospora ATCC 24927]EGX53941.1 hypothetical protein AOL_s00004g600 [Orbilia oligospora ATCC 24927]